MGSAFHQLCPRYSGTLTPTAPTAFRLWDAFTFYYQHQVRPVTSSCIVGFKNIIRHKCSSFHDYLSLALKVKVTCVYIRYSDTLYGLDRHITLSCMVGLCKQPMRNFFFICLFFWWGCWGGGIVLVSILNLSVPFLFSLPPPHPSFWVTA